MTTITQRIAPAPYASGTASMLVDTEAHPIRDAASESSAARAFPIESARCATYPTPMEWVPDRELSVVPEVMTALCRRCPGRQTCLLWALAGKEQGYWAGTTTADRVQMGQLAQESIETADWLQALARRDHFDGALHAEGDGSYWWYRRRGCRCGECKSGNAVQRATERAKARCRVEAGEEVACDHEIGKTRDQMGAAVEEVSEPSHDVDRSTVGEGAQPSTHPGGLYGREPYGSDRGRLG